MSGPWEDYAPAKESAGRPWETYAAPSKPLPGMETAKSIAGTVNTGVNWLGTQFTKGATGMIGMPAVLGDLGKSGFEYIGNKVGMPEAGSNAGNVFKNQMTFGGVLQRPETYNSAVFDGMGVPEVNAGDTKALTLHQPLGINGDVNIGKMLDAGAQAVPGAVALGTGILPAFFGGVTSESLGQATHGTPWELPARIFGSLPGAYFGSKLTTPLPANLTPQQARAVDLAKANGVPLSVGQETGRGIGMERFLSRMPGGQGVSDRFAGTQGAATDELALAQAGYSGREIGQDTMKGLARQAGDEFNAAKSMPGTIDLNPAFPRVKDALADYQTIMEPAKRSPAVQGAVDRFLSREPGPPTYPKLPPAEAITRPPPTLDNLTTAIRNADRPVGEAFETLPTTADLGPLFRPRLNVSMPKELPELSNPQYQTFRADLSKTINGLYEAKDTNGAKALQAVRNALDDAAGASLDPDKQAAWQQARQHYSNFKIIEKAMNNGTASARSEGTLGTAALERALKSRQGDTYYRTTGGLNDVATIKGYLRDTFPNSGSPTIGAGIAAAANPFTGGLLGLGFNTAARTMTGQGWATPLGPLLPLPASVVRNYLANQALPNRMQNVAMSAPLSVVPSLADQSMALLRLAAPR